MPPRSPHIVVAGHICVDIIPEFLPRPGGSTHHIDPGQLYLMGPVAFAPGGVVSNTGLALRKLGVSTSLVGKVGDDMFGTALLEILAATSPELTRHMIVAAGENTSYSIVISPPGVDRAFLHCPGANDTYRASDIAINTLANASLLHFGYPTLMEQIYSDGGRQLRELFEQAQALGVVTSLDMSMPDPQSPAGQVDWREWLGRVLPTVDIFLPSFDELLFMLDRPRFEQQQASGTPSAETDCDVGLMRRLTGELLEWGVGIAGLKLGEQGLYLRTGEKLLPSKRLIGSDDTMAIEEQWANRELLAPCFVVEPVGTTGAGDCTIAGFLAALVRGATLAEAAVQAVGVGACCVESPDATAGVQSTDQVAARIANDWPRHQHKTPADGWNWHPTRGVWEPAGNR